MEFQFGTNWARFSNYAGGVIGQTLAMEGVFAFFAESVFLGIFLAGSERLDDPDALVAWDQRQRRLDRPVAVRGVDVGVA
jgi:cytochrome bd ubiquinol oxidase subunit I